MIETLISSKTRIKLLLKFFLNSSNRSYLRGLEAEFKESTNAIRQELNKFEEAGLLISENEGNKKYFKANLAHPLHNDLKSIIYKMVGLDTVIENVVLKLGDLNRVYLSGKFSKGLDSDLVELIFIGEIDKEYLQELCEKAELLIKRKIKKMVYNLEEYMEATAKENFSQYLLLWSK
ncbi:MAG: ArsR family transcriptional regulator [Bacteroidota bacterium]|nr:ArsR family transcriptional regulator [Bacteroidota bacterium]